MRYFLIFVSLATILGLIWSFWSNYTTKIDNNILKIGTEGLYKPFNYLDKEGNLTGFDIDIAKELCIRIKKKCKFIKNDWVGLIPSLEAGQFDAVIASVSITKERKKSVNFTNKYYKVAFFWYDKLHRGVIIFIGKIN